MELETTSTKAATSCPVVLSRSSTASTVKVALARHSPAASSGTTPSADHASVAASSTFSHVSMRRCCVQTAPISSLVYLVITQSPPATNTAAPSGRDGGRRRVQGRGKQLGVAVLGQLTHTSPVQP